MLRLASKEEVCHIMSFTHIWFLKKPFFSLDSESNSLKSRVIRSGNTATAVLIRYSRLWHPSISAKEYIVTIFRLLTVSTISERVECPGIWPSSLAERVIGYRAVSARTYQYLGVEIKEKLIFVWPHAGGLQLCLKTNQGLRNQSLISFQSYSEIQVCMTILKDPAVTA